MNFITHPIHDLIILSVLVLLMFGPALLGLVMCDSERFALTKGRRQRASAANIARLEAANYLQEQRNKELIEESTRIGHSYEDIELDDEEVELVPERNRIIY